MNVSTVDYIKDEDAKAAAGIAGNAEKKAVDVKEAIQADIDQAKTDLAPVKQTETYKKVCKWALTIGLIIAVIFSCYGLYRLFTGIHSTSNEPKPPTVNLTLDGKPGSPTAPQVLRVQGNDTTTHTISYVPKIIDPLTGQKEGTDFQLDTKKPVVTVKVNGKTTEVPTLDNETQKFEDGKLVVTEEHKSDIEITGPEPSRWQATYMRNGDGKNAIGVSYALGKVVRANAMVIDGEKPFIGLSADLGDLMSTKKKK